MENPGFAHFTLNNHLFHTYPNNFTVMQSGKIFGYCFYGIEQERLDKSHDLPLKTAMDDIVV